MGAAIVQAFLSVLAKNPAILEDIIQAGLQYAVQELQKAVTAAK